MKGEKDDRGLRMELQEIGQEKRILLVEDDKEIREGIEIFLKGQGYKVFQAADGWSDDGGKTAGNV